MRAVAGRELLDAVGHLTRLQRVYRRRSLRRNHRQALPAAIQCRNATNIGLCSLRYSELRVVRYQRFPLCCPSLLLASSDTPGATERALLLLLQLLDNVVIARSTRCEHNAIEQLLCLGHSRLLHPSTSCCKHRRSRPSSSICQPLLFPSNLFASAPLFALPPDAAALVNRF